MPISAIKAQNISTMNVNNKGKRGERLWRDFLNENGFTGSYRHGQQTLGGSIDRPDVVCPQMVGWHHEVKFTEKLNIHKAMKQAIDDSMGQRKPLVASKRVREEWLVTMKASDFLELVKDKTDIEFAVDNAKIETR